MKKILGTVLLFFLLNSNAHPQSMISIKDYLVENKEFIKDPIVFSYVLKRCGAAYLYASAITIDKDKKTADSLSNAYEEGSLFAVNLLMKEMGWSQEKATKSLFTDMSNMGKYYKKDGNDSFARTGSYMMNNYIGEDLGACKQIVETIIK